VYYRDEFEKSRAGQLLRDYHHNKWPLWTKAQYGGELRSIGNWTPQTHLAFLTVQTLGRPSIAGMLLYVDMGHCSMVGRDENYSVCKGEYANNTALVILPGVFQRWEQPDPLTYTFSVRKGVLWPAIPPMNRTDREVTAQDIAWFLDTVKRESILKDNFALVKAFEAPDRYTVRVKMEAPYAELLPNMAHLSMALFAKECYDEKGCIGAKQITPAPFLVKEDIPRQRTVFERNPEFFLKGLPYMDRMLQVNIADVNAQKAAVANGQMDFLGFQGFLEAEQLWKQTPGGKIQTEGILAGVQAFEPRYTGPFADVRVRRAMAMAMDHKTIHTAAESFNWLPTLVSRQYFGPDFQMSIDSQASEWYRFNPQRAKQLLTEAGYGNGFTTSLTSATCSGANYDMMLVVQANWKKYLSVDMAIKCVDAVAFRTAQYGNKWEGMVYLRPHNLGYWAGADVAILRLVSTSAVNFQKVNDPKIDQLYLAERAELDPAKRVKLLWDFEQYEMDQVYYFRLAWTWGIMVKQGWELNCAGHEMTYCGATNGPGWLSMMDPSKTPKR
jgi:peptide/nickel transport system substrate-binding protein